MDKLLKIGFMPIGTCKYMNNELEIILNHSKFSKNVIYCFTIDSMPMYFGITRGTISKRMYQYMNPAKSQSTNIRINELLINELKEGKEVHVYMFEDNGHLMYGDFKIKLCLGLEESLIECYQTPWNLVGNYKLNNK